MAHAYKGILILLWGMMVLCPFSGYADRGTEIDHLLETIDASECMFIRNGKHYNSSEAGAHIRRKYAHIKGRIGTTEDFIKYAATKSSLTGRPYQVVCKDTKMATADWLEEELERFRRTGD